MTVRASDPDDAVTSLDVRLQYYVSNSYQGEVRMNYDASRHLFSYQLPAVETRDVGLQGGFLEVVVTVTDPSGLVPRPTAPPGVPIDSCMGTIGNS